MPFSAPKEDLQQGLGFTIPESDNALDTPYQPTSLGTSVPQSEPGILDRIAGDYRTRMGNVSAKADEFLAGDRSRFNAEGGPSYFTTLLYGGGQGTGLAGDVAGEALKSLYSPVKDAYNSLPQGIRQPINEAAKDAYLSVSASPVGDLARGAVGAYKNFEANNPETASNLGSLASIFSAGTGAALPIGPAAAAVSEKVAEYGLPALAKGSDLVKDAKGALANTAKLAPAALFGGQADDATLQLANRAVDLGIPLKATQIGDSKPARFFDSVTGQLPFSGAQDFEQTQREAFNIALARSIGENSTNLGPDTIKSFAKRNGQAFNEALGGNEVLFVPESQDGLSNILARAKKNLSPSNYEIVANNAEDLTKAIKEGRISAEKAASLRSDLLESSVSAESQARPYISRILEHLDDDISKSIPEEAATKLSQARREYRNFKTLEPLLEKSTDGSISPAALNQRVASSKYIKASKLSIGDDDLVDLARIGQRFLKQQVPDSGTAQRTAFTNFLTGGAAFANLPATGAGLVLGRAYQAANRNPARVSQILGRDNLFSPATNMFGGQ